MRLPTCHIAIVVGVPPHEAALAPPRLAAAGDGRAAQLDALLHDVQRLLLAAVERGVPLLAVRRRPLHGAPTLHLATRTQI